MAWIRIKRAYDPPESADGTRVLADRLWPSGLAKSDAQVAVWAKDTAPSDELRRWFAHDVAKWPEFRARYRAELANNPGLIELRRMAAQATTLTLLFAAKDVEHNNAAVLRDVLRETD